MTQTTQTFNMDTVVGATLAPAAVDSLANDSVAVTIQSIEAVVEKQIDGKEDSMLPLGLSIAAIVFVLAIGYMLYKFKSLMKSEVSKLQKDLETLKDDNLKLKDKLSEFEDSLRTTGQDVSEISHSLKDISNKIVTTESSIKTEKKPVEMTTSASSPKRNVELVFANLQSPDQNGTLRFAVRGFSAQPNPLKMFVLEIDNNSGKGTYKINPDATSMIMNDLQLFNSFVKPYNFTGNTDMARITTQRPGIINKEGQFWVVEELLEISIK